MSQKEIIYYIVKENHPIRTEQVKILGMSKGVSCADRFLRWLREEGYLKKERKEGDRTDTWYLTDKLYQEEALEKAAPLPVVFNDDGQGVFA